jgi:hypothetical protein
MAEMDSNKQFVMNDMRTISAQTIENKQRVKSIFHKCCKLAAASCLNETVGDLHPRDEFYRSKPCHAVKISAPKAATMAETLGPGSP